MSGAARVVVVIPAYRVASHIEAVVRGVPPWVTGVIVVDDASPDDTASCVERLAAADPRVTLVRHPVNTGVGGAVRTGYARALELGADVVVKMDGDGQMDPAWLEALVAPVVRGEADFAKGNRFHHGRELERMPKLRLLGNGVLGFLVRLSSGYWNVYDPTNGYTAIHAAALRRLELDALGRRYWFETSQLHALYLIGARVVDVPIPARYGQERSGLKVGRVLLGFPPRLVAALLRRLWLRHLLWELTVVGLYSVLGALLVAFGAVFGTANYWRSIATGRTATAGTVMLAALPLILGCFLLVQALALDAGYVPAQPLPRGEPPGPPEPGRGAPVRPDPRPDRQLGDLTGPRREVPPAP